VLIPARSTLLAAFLARVDWTRVCKVDTRRYSPHYVTGADAERLPWSVFVDRLPVLFTCPPGLGGLEIVGAAKSVTWSDRDLNIYVGRQDGPVRSFWDFTADEFVAVFGWHLELACQVSAMLDRDVYVTHGFNPEDTSPDAHSVAARFHTHFHIPQTHGRCRVDPHRLTHFERLALVEPYSEVCWDRAAAFLADRGPGPWLTAPGLGFFSLAAPLRPAITTAALSVLGQLLGDLHVVYRQVVAAVTDGGEESRTGCARYVPRTRPEREARMATFLAANAGWLSGESAGLLAYLTQYVKPAAPRENPRSTRIASAAQAWIAKGLSGALNFVVSAATERVRFDVAPRVISTSGAAKVIGAGPTLVVKDQGPASVAEQTRMADFHAAVVAALATAGRLCAGAAAGNSAPRRA